MLQKEDPNVYTENSIYKYKNNIDLEYINYFQLSFLLCEYENISEYKDTVVRSCMERVTASDPLVVDCHMCQKRNKTN